MNFPAALVFSTTLSICVLSTFMSLLKVKGKLTDTTRDLVVPIAIGVVLNQLGCMLHEFGHDVVAKFFGMKTIWGGSLYGYQIITDPPPYEAEPLAQLMVGMAGSFVSLLVVAVIWIVLSGQRKDTSMAIVFGYLLFTQGLGNLGSSIFFFSADAAQIAQGISRLGGISTESVGIVMLITSIVWSIAVIKKLNKHITLAY